MYAINKQGLREKPNYDELINYLQNKQEKIVYPDRFAKRLRESPQLSNLLDGEGFDIHDIQDQQISQAKEIAKNLAIIQADGDAKILNTMNKKMQTLPTNPVGKKVSGMQTDEPRRKTQGVQVEETQYFDMAVDDKIADVNEQIEMELDKNDSNQEQQRANIVNILQSHLGEITDQQTEFVQQLIQPDSGGASSSGLASSSTAIQSVKKTTTKQSKKDPETAVEQKGKAGRPKKDTDARMEQLEQQSTPEKRDRKESNGNGDKPPKAKQKTKKQEKDEKRQLAALMNTTVKEQKKEEKKNAPEVTPSSSSAPVETSSPKAKKTIEKPKKIAPSQIGIQKVREELEQAKIAGKLDTQDTSAYMILYDEWRDAKGNQKLKKEKLNALREIYKRTVYKK